MYPFDSDLHLVALSPELQHQLSNTTVKLNIQHHLQQAAKTPARCDYAETQQTSRNQGRRPHQFYTLPPLGGGYYATQRTPPTSTPHVKGNADYRFLQPSLPSVCGHGIQICVDMSILYGVLWTKSTPLEPYSPGARIPIATHMQLE